MRSLQTLSIKKLGTQRVNGLKSNSVLKIKNKPIVLLNTFNVKGQRVVDISLEYLFLVEYPEGYILSLNDELLVLKL